MTPIIGSIVMLIAGLLVVVAYRRIRSDARRFSNAAWIVAALATFVLAATLLGNLTFVGAGILLLMLSPLLITGLVLLLLVNGVVMLLKEGRSLANLLSLLAGLGLMAAIYTCFKIFMLDGELLPISLWIGLSGAWAAGLFFTFVGYSWLYQRIVRKRRPSFVVALGSGLIGDRVPPLLRSRIERALSCYQTAASAGGRPLLVMSGGQGPKELVSEAQAMGAYAVERGADQTALVLETKSTTTEENLRFSCAQVRRRLGLAEDQPLPPGVAVTSNYHAMRAAMLARRLGLPLDALGAPTARYFLISATLREFVAILRDNWKTYAISYAVVALPLPILFAIVLWLF